MKQGFKRIVSMALIASMIATMAPSTAWAASVDNTDAVQVEAQTAADEEAAPVAESAADTKAVETETETEPAAAEETETAVETESETQTETETETPIYTIGNIKVNFQGANAALAEQLTKDVELDESDPAIQGMRQELENLEIAGGEAGMEEDAEGGTGAAATYADRSAVAVYDGDSEAAATTNALSKDQIDTVLKMYQQYLDQWADNANVLGVQNPFFLDYNDDNEDGLGVLGQMLALDGKTVDQVRSGEYSYDDLTGMIITFTYGDKLGIQYYGSDVEQARTDALAAVDASGAQTKAQKLLVLNDWLAHNNTFDMSYIMNSGKSDDEKPMVAKDPQKQEHEDEVYNVLYDVYEPQIKQNFHDQIFAGIEQNLLVTFYENAIQNAVYQKTLGKDESEATDEEKSAAQEQAKAYIEQNKEAIDKDPEGYVKTNFGEEAAAKMKTEADAFIKDAEENGVAMDSSKPEQKATVEQMTQAQLESDDPALDLDNDGTKETSFKAAIPIYAKQAATGMTTGVINYWEGSQFGAFGMGTSVCLGYSKAFTYLVQCLDKDVYLKTPSAGYDSSNWKTAKELYYGEDGKTIDINAGYTVDLVRIHFKSDVTMYGEEQEDFGSDHYWNAVKVDGQWYYIDSCYTDVYTEVMSRDRVETDGDMNHVFFLFSETSTESLYSGNYSEIKSLYTSAATDKTYETAWMSRAASNVYYKDGYAYYLYDSTDLFSQVSNNSMNQSSTEYKLVRHKLTSDDKTDGDSDYETLINFTDKENDDDDDTFVSVLNKDGKMEKNDALTKLYEQFKNDQSQYPSLSLTAALYDGKLYFNLSNDVLAYNLADNTVAVVKEYNEVSAKRDNTKLFGGMAFTTTNKDNADFTVTNHPIAGLTVKGDNLIVSIGTNFAFISGKSSITDHSSYGYEFEETDYNSGYTNYKKYQQYMGSQKNDNDEFMWSANFVDTVDLKTLTGTSHNYETVSIPAYCGRNAFTEERCSDCGLIKDGTRVEEEGTAHEHHYIKFHETYYTKDDNGNWNEADNYVCPECGASSTEPVKSQFSQAQSNYEKKKAIWDEAQKNAAEGHVYTPTDAKWSDDNTTVTFQNLRCESCYDKLDKLDCLLTSDTNETNKANRDSIDKSLSAAVTANSEVVSRTGTCDKGVTTNYKAEGKTDDGYKYTVTKKATAEAGKHAYTGTWTWNETKDANGNVTDATATVADVKCEVCGNVPTADQITVNVTKATTAATCEADGKDVYTATATVKDADGKEVGTLTDTHEIVLKALGHDYGEPVWSEWTEKDGKWTTTATFTCSHDKTHVQTPEVKVTETSAKPTCEEDGDVTYTATTELDGKTFTNPTKKTVTVKAQGHDYQPVVTKATTEKDGKIVYTCTRCGKVEKEEAISYPKTIELAKTVYTFDGQEKKPEVTVTAADGKTIVADGNYTVSYPEAKDAGTYTVKVTFTGDYYEGTVEKTFTINKAKAELAFAEAEKSVDYTTNGTVTNDLSVTAPEESAKDAVKYSSSNDKIAAVAEDGTVTIVGYGTVTIKAEMVGDGNYEAVETTYTLTINPLATPVAPTLSNAKTTDADGKVVSGVTVKWEAVEGAESYRVFRKSGNGGWKKVGLTSETSFTDTTAASGTVYTYTVRCTNAAGDVYTSDYDRTGSDLRYLAMSNISSLTNGNGNVVIKWNKVTGANGYCVYRKTEGEGFKKIAQVKGNGSVSYTDKGANVSGTTYIYAVRPYNGTTKGAYVEKSIAYLANGTIKTLSNTTSGVSVKWNAVDGAEGYYVYRKPNGGSYTQIAKVTDGQKVSYTDKDAKSGTTYTYAVRAYKAGTRGAYTGKTVLYLSSGKVSSVSNSKDGVNVKWAKVTGAKGYYVYRKTGSKGYTKIATIKSGSTVSYMDKSVQKDNGKAYTYAIRPYNGKVMGSYAGKSLYRLTTPTLSSASNSASKSVKVSWKKGSSVNGYQIQYSTDSKFSKNNKTVLVESASTTSTTIKSLTKGSTYYVRIRTYKTNASGTKYYSGWTGSKSVKVSK